MEVIQKLWPALMGLSTKKTQNNRCCCYINSDFHTLWEGVFISVMQWFKHLHELARASASVPPSVSILLLSSTVFFHSYHSKGKKFEFSNNFSTPFHSWQHRRCPWLLSCLQKRILNDQIWANTVYFYACWHLSELLNWHFHWSICDASICGVTQEQ